MKFLSTVVLLLAAVAMVCASPLLAEGKKKALPEKPIDLNSGTKAEIMMLPGIGEKTAEAIIAGRPYASVDELTKVKGIGEKKLEKLRPHLTVGGAAAAEKPKAEKPKAEKAEKKKSAHEDESPDAEE